MNEKNTKAKSVKTFKRGTTSSKTNDNNSYSAKKSFKKFKRNNSNKKWGSQETSHNKFRRDDNKSSDRRFSDNNSEKRKNYRDYRDNKSNSSNNGEARNNRPSTNFRDRKFSENNGEKRERRSYRDNKSDSSNDGEKKQERRKFNKFSKNSRNNNHGGGFRGGRGGNKSGVGQRGGGFRGQRISISAFINKPTETTTLETAFIPTHQFTDFKVDGRITKNLKQKGYEVPSPIQDKTIPHILSGKDLVGLANTGTGKTAAFLVPLINKILKNLNNQVLVLAPTRELALQIEKEFQNIARGLNLFSVVCVGGANIHPQIQKLRKRQHLIIGTPGRTIDLIKRNVLRLEQVKTIVIDEADRMLDMGFLNDVRFILAKVSEERQTLCFSATMPTAIETLIKDFLKNPVTISVKTQDTSKNVHQDIVRINGRDKKEVLYEMLVEEEFKKVLVFGRTKHGVEKLSISLNKSGIKSESIHGNKSHNQRQSALKNFTNDKANVLIATDVAARGLDIKNVSHVINFDIPATYEDYIHRIGRTGRANNTGKALTFVD